MARKVYPPTQLRKKSDTLPPKAWDIKFYAVEKDPHDDFVMDPEFINFSFTFKENESIARSPAYEFQIDILNLDTGVYKSFVQLANKYYYKFWQRQAEVYTLSPKGFEINLEEESIINSKITVTPINDFGMGEQSTFFLLFKNVAWMNKLTNRDNPVFSVVNKYWHLYSEEPNNRLNRPKTIYIYINTDHDDIDSDVLLLGSSAWEYTSLSDYQTINERTYRWSVQDDGFYKRDQYGWHLSTSEEKEYIENLVQASLPWYRKYLAANNIQMGLPHIFKMGINNPADEKDSIIIYLIKGMRWRP
jgi:hypothetical protein